MLPAMISCADSQAVCDAMLLFAHSTDESSLRNVRDARVQAAVQCLAQDDQSCRLESGEG